MNHRVFERTLRSLVFRGAHLFECYNIVKLGDAFVSKVIIRLVYWALPYPANGIGLALKILADLCGIGFMLGVITSQITEDILRDGRLPICGLLSNLGFADLILLWDSCCAYSLILTSNQVGLPAELKHINKRRKRN